MGKRRPTYDKLLLLLLFARCHHSCLLEVNEGFIRPFKGLTSNAKKFIKTTLFRRHFTFWNMTEETRKHKKTHKKTMTGSKHIGLMARWSVENAQKDRRYIKRADYKACVFWHIKIIKTVLHVMRK